MEINQNQFANKNVVNPTEFLKQYNELLDYIGTHNLITYIEEAHKTTLINARDISTIGRLNSILFKIFDGNVECLRTFNTFMQQINITYNNSLTKSAQLNAKLGKLKGLYIDILLGLNNLIADPFNTSSIASAVQQNSSIINITLLRNDGEAFASSLNFNSMINIINQFTTTLDTKLKSGNNAIDLQLINNYNVVTESLKQSIEEFKKKNNLI